MQGRCTIGLYNSYDPNRFHEIHRRSITRTLPLCVGFDCNLAIFGFPLPPDIKTPNELCAFLAEKTTISTKETLMKLAAGGRFCVFPFPEHGFPPQLGKIVIATDHPKKEKLIDTPTIATLLANGKSVCVIFGLGHRGLGKIEELGEFHYEVTGKNVSLETCTALGAVIGSINTALKIVKERA